MANKVNRYKEILRDLNEWDLFLMKESGLPGPRANLELLAAVADAGDEDTFNRYAYEFTPEQASTNSPEVFLVLCGVAGMGKLITSGKTHYFRNLRDFANDPRWRVREAVAIALQTVGEQDMNMLLAAMEQWSKGNRLEQRAVVAALCEPKLLKPKEAAQKVLEILDHLTSDSLKERNRKDEDFKTLRKALGYGWSVAVVAYPEKGKHMMEHWLTHVDKDIHWIMKENLRKDRLMKMDKVWTTKWLRVVVGMVLIILSLLTSVVSFSQNRYAIGVETGFSDDKYKVSDRNGNLINIPCISFVAGINFREQIDHHLFYELAFLVKQYTTGFALQQQVSNVGNDAFVALLIPARVGYHLNISDRVSLVPLIGISPTLKLPGKEEAAGSFYEKNSVAEVEWHFTTRPLKRDFYALVQGGLGLEHTPLLFSNLKFTFNCNYYYQWLWTVNALDIQYKIDNGPVEQGNLFGMGRFLNFSVGVKYGW
ncbi:hypothetical protein OCK74_17335 [Chitinophagaceae bacterium LB-8]|uniref:HEAT repeat domain-containing protein n=1 Tax=Paraflavisolibacter caeni TaxID=2982496 RepID=A0A9X2XY52_9BACT|nr:hypothetical protein [Paraflavisolibacter caeni]MCU7550887.1 hypothetical protein [Paraflavisolibacter caeni]